MLLNSLRSVLKDIFTRNNVSQEDTLDVLKHVMLIENVLSKLFGDLDAQERFTANIQSCLSDRQAKLNELQQYFEEEMKEWEGK